MRRFPRRDALRAALDAELTRACAAGAGPYVALAVGETTLPHYGRLGPDSPAFADKVFLPVDELVPPPAHREVRFAARLKRALPGGLAKRVREVQVEPDPEAEARRLEVTLGAGALCACVLGLGPDGHVAFNQPPSGAGTPTRIVDIAPANLARLGGVAPARRALTLGIATLLASDWVALVVDGPGKERALERVLHGPEGADVPASWLRRHPRAVVLIHDPGSRRP